MKDIVSLVIKRLALGLITIIVISVLIFVGVEALPGDKKAHHLQHHKKGGEAYHGGEGLTAEYIGNDDGVSGHDATHGKAEYEHEHNQGRQ